VKITPEYLQQIIQEETNILLFEKRLGRELTTEEIERLRELRGIRSSSEKSAEKAWEKELEKIRAGESDEEREAADARQAQYARALAIQQAQLDIPIDRTPGGRKSPQAAADPPKELAQQAQQEAEAEDLQTIVDQQHEKGKEDKLLGQVMSLIGDSRKLASDAAYKIEDLADAAAGIRAKSKDDPVRNHKDYGKLLGIPKYQVWAQEFEKIGGEGEKWIPQWEQGWHDYDPKMSEKELRDHIDLYMKKAYRAEIFLKQMRQGDLKELLVPLITQVLKENTK